MELYKIIIAVYVGIPLAAGEPDGASDPLLWEKAGDRILVLLRWLLDQVLQNQPTTVKLIEFSFFLFFNAVI